MARKNEKEEAREEAEEVCTQETELKLTKQQAKEMGVDDGTFTEIKEEELTITDIPGVGAATSEKLSVVGYTDMMSIATASPGELIEAAGLTEASAKKMIAFARKALRIDFESGIDILKKRQEVIRLSTGSKALNDLLGGGVETGAITECFGQYGSSKTQIGHQLAVNVQTIKSDKDPVAVYIDTENTFRPERIIQLAKALGLDENKVLQNIKVARAFNSDHQVLLAEKVGDLIKKEGLNVKLLVVDSLTAHFRAEFIGRGTLADRQQKINKHMRTLSSLAATHNLCVYVTNQVMAKPDQFFGDPTEAIGGNIVAHNSTFRIYLRRGKKGTRVGKLVDSPNLAEAECCFMVTEEGVRDV